MRLLKMMTIGAATTACAFTGAMAADLPPIYDAPLYESVPEVQPVEIGTGWYLRGDVAYDFQTDLPSSYELRSVDPSGTSILATGSYDGLKLQSGVTGSGGIGYQFTDYLRGDVTLGYWKQDIGDARLGDFKVRTSAKGLEVMGNAYADLGTYVGFTPYVGAGVGGVRLEYNSTCSYSGISCGDGLNSFFADDNADWRFAYSVMAGVAYDVSKNLKFDVGYRYLNVDGGSATAIRGGLPNSQTTYQIDGEDDGFDRHTITAGLRYSLW
ncbi:outer membrane protein [Aurantimonas sp. VKM B-3413]|uniref:outer membrane protein n=1 Tax=Aurantimonas sp. VKM B-3413 TaxID=2779401 RepID=UPI001E38F2A5|nr:outer membrane beta-barrel protein [Aurantimonas sp. VKM B-3413]MCB8839073.1 outer membrane beta-barrel protein [Aurantimonas sp. VKM B-3413]